MLSVLTGLSGIAVCLAWILPGAKRNAVFGRLSYPELLVAIGLTLLCLCIVAITCCPRRRRRSIGFRIAVLVLASLLTLTAWEAASYLLPGNVLKHNPWYVWASGGTRESNDLMFERPPNLKWKGLSNGDIGEHRDNTYATLVTFETDFEGFRNEEDIRQADVVFIGDSHTEAGNVPIEDTFAQRVRRALSASVRNLGRASYGPSQELIVLKQYGLKCKPRVVVWQICETNDMTEEIWFHSWIKRSRPRMQGITDRSRREVWKRRSPTYQLFDWVRRSDPWPLRGTFRDAENKIHPMCFLYVTGKEQLPKGNKGWPFIEKSLREGAQVLADKGIDLIVMCIPMKIRVMGQYVEPGEMLIAIFKKHLKKMGLDTNTTLSQWDLHKDQTLAWHLEQVCQNLNVPFIDTTPSLRKNVAEGKLVYHPYETHFSSLGHMVVADLLQNHPILQGIGPQ